MAKESTSEMMLSKEVVSKAIEAIRVKGWDVNPFTIADEMNISRALIYQNIEFMSQILEARGGTFGIDVEASLDIAYRMQELQQQVNTLEDRVQVLYAELQRTTGPLRAITPSIASGVEPPTVGSPSGVPVESPSDRTATGATAIGEESWTEPRKVQDAQMKEEVIANREEALDDTTTYNALSAANLPGELSTSDTHWRELEAVIRAHVITLDSVTPASLNKSKEENMQSLQAEPVIEVPASPKKKKRASKKRQAEEGQKPVSPVPIEVSSTEADLLLVPGTDEVKEPSPALSVSRLPPSIDYGDLFESVMSLVKPEIESPVVEQIDAPPVVKEQSLAEVLASPEGIESQPPVFSDLSLAGPHYAFDHFSPAQTEAFLPEEVEESFIEIDSDINEQIYDKPSPALEVETPNDGAVPDLDEMDIFEDIDDDTIQYIEVIEDVVPPPEEVAIPPFQFDREGTGKKEKLDRLVDTVSGEALRELIKKRIDQASEHTIEQQGLEQGVAAKSKSKAKDRDNDKEKAQDRGKEKSEEKDIEEKGKDLTKSLNRSKFVGSKATESQAPIPFVSRVIPPEIRRACLILGVSPEEINIAAVNSCWKQQIASPGVHPDLGGDTESAIYLNTAKDILLRWLDQQAPKLGKTFGQAAKDVDKQSVPKDQKHSN